MILGDVLRQLITTILFVGDIGINMTNPSSLFFNEGNKELVPQSGVFTHYRRFYPQMDAYVSNGNHTYKELKSLSSIGIYPKIIVYETRMGYTTGPTQDLVETLSSFNGVSPQPFLVILLEKNIKGFKAKQFCDALDKKGVYWDPDKVFHAQLSGDDEKDKEEIKRKVWRAWMVKSDLGGYDVTPEFITKSENHWDNQAGFFSESVLNRVPETVSNIVVLGKLGAGKSTIINLLLNMTVAATGAGKSITKGNVMYPSEEYHAVFIDTEGFGSGGKVDVESVKGQVKRNDNYENMINYVIYCVSGDRFDEKEQELIKGMKDFGVIVLVAITKNDKKGFSNCVKQDLINKGVYSGTDEANKKIFLIPSEERANNEGVNALKNYLLESFRNSTVSVDELQEFFDLKGANKQRKERKAKLQELLKDKPLFARWPSVDSLANEKANEASAAIIKYKVKARDLAFNGQKLDELWHDLVNKIHKNFESRSLSDDKTYEDEIYNRVIKKQGEYKKPFFSFLFRGSTRDKAMRDTEVFGNACLEIIKEDFINGIDGYEKLMINRAAKIKRLSKQNI